MSDHDDFAFEPVPGLPAHLPRGEDMLWQGRPDAWALARDAYAIRWVMGYFVALTIWRFGAAAADAPLATATFIALPYLVLGVVTCGILWLMARAQARTTVYTLTSARVVMRVGAVLPVTFNLPFTQIETARLDLRANGTGTIAIEPKGDVRLSYLVLWPHVRPWHLRKSQPALRCIPNAAEVAKLLADAAETRLSVPVVSRTTPNVATLVAAE